jgi:competence protein ComEA
MIRGARELCARVHERVAGAAWTPLAARAGAYALGFALLVLVGSGRLSRWVSPPAPVIATAEAATARPAASASTSAPAPSVSASAAADAGAPDSVAEAGDAGDGGASSGVASDGKVILNLATEEDLRRLPGVGPTRAKAILALRARMKRLGRVEDLLKVKGIGRRSLARLRPLVRVD